jgi:hypothetical protein
MTPRDAPALGPPIAFTLRIGTVLAVVGIGAGYLLEGMPGEATNGSVAALIAGTLLARRGERGRAIAALLAFALLLASLIAAAVLGGTS